MLKTWAWGTAVQKQECWGAPISGRVEGAVLSEAGSHVTQCPVISELSETLPVSSEEPEPWGEAWGRGRRCVSSMNVRA